MVHRRSRSGAVSLAAIAGTVVGIVLAAPTTNADFTDTRRGLILITITSDGWQEEEPPNELEPKEEEIAPILSEGSEHED